MKAANDDKLVWNTPDAADADYLYVPGRLLFLQEDRIAVQAAFNDRSEDFAEVVTIDDIDTPSEPLPGLLAVGVVRSAPPDGDEPDDGGVEAALAIFDDELGEGVVSPEYYLHLANGDGKHCPATEPEETGLAEPWPPLRTQTDDGTGVRVAVIDTGWHPPAALEPATASYLGADVDAATPNDNEPYNPNQLELYEGHGTFIAGVIRCRAPKAEIRHYMIGAGGAVSETEMVDAIYRALDEDGGPQIINLSAGCHTRRDHGPKSFQRLWRDRLRGHPEIVLVAAAGNDASSLPFYPAARHWAVGVGSIDRADPGAVSSFSNYGASADVYVLGRNHVNAFPKGTYVCQEAPNKDDVREFTNGLARWSGTSFAAPLFAGLVAARLSRTQGSIATQVARDLVSQADQRPDPVHGTHRYIRIADNDWDQPF
jgi:subtilisin family serine protease